MQLIIRYNNSKPEIVYPAPTKKFISKTLHSVDWKQISSFCLEKDDLNLLAVSRDTVSENLTSVYYENGEVYTYDYYIENVLQIEPIILHFLDSNNDFKSLGFSKFEAGTTKEVSNTNYKLWQIQYKAQEKTEKRNNVWATIAATLVVSLFFLMVYLWFTEELQFVGYATEETTATIDLVQKKPTHGGYYESVRYEFIYENIIYKGFFRGSKTTGHHFVGDKIKIKFRISNPSFSKRLYTYKRNY